MNACTDMLSCLPHRLSNRNNENELNGPDIIDKTFEFSMIKSSNISPKTSTQYGHQITNNQCTKEEFNLHSYGLVAEQTKDKELLKLKGEI